jgi:hypothetical protein
MENARPAGAVPSRRRPPTYTSPVQFFQPPERARRPEQPPLPEWLGPPTHEVGEPVPGRAVVARSDAAAVLQGVVAYSNGFRLTIGARVRDADPWIDVIGGRAGPIWERGEIPDTMLRLGLEMPDGRRATNLNRPPYPPSATRPQLVFVVGGGGGGAVWDLHAWSWPLPPPEPFDLVCEWPGVGIPLTRHALDGAAIRAAAALSAPLWKPD